MNGHWTRMWRRPRVSRAPGVLAVVVVLLLTAVGPAAVLTSPQFAAELIEHPEIVAPPPAPTRGVMTLTAAELACQPDSELPRIQRQALGDGAPTHIFRLVAGDHAVVVAYHAAPAAKAAILWLSGADGGLDGPFDGFYERLAVRLQGHGLTSLRLEYRKPMDLDESVRDALLALRFLAEHGLCNVGVVGFSFGGAVAIEAAALRPQVRAVVLLASQGLGTDRVDEIAPRPLLVVYPVGDEVVPPELASEDIFARAGEPKELVRLASSDHYLTDRAPEVEALVASWLEARLAGGPPTAVR